MKSVRSTFVLFLGWILCTTAVVQACTDILVTPGASVDGSAMIAYNADSPGLYGSIYHYPPSMNNTVGTMRKVYDWDSGVYLGEIPQARETYNVVGNMNEYGLVIGESTFGGVAKLAMNQTGAIIDYGSLIYLTLQRAKNVSQAIQTMVHLMDTYGYYSAGESFSLADPTGQVWMMEVIGRGSDYPDPATGKHKLGAVWVAVRIPDGAVAAHANQARITTFPRDDPAHCLYADDVVDVAIHYGLYPKDADPLEFSFSDVYNPLDFIGARQGEARVWSIFSQIADTNGVFQHIFQQYAMGTDLKRRMPLYVNPVHRLSPQKVMHLMTSHYEGTVLDSSGDVGAGLFASPYRPRPLVWDYKDKGDHGTSKDDDKSGPYHNERSVATPKTGWSFVAQVRPWMPPELAALGWYALDDSSTAPRLPIYGSSRRIPVSYAGKGCQDGVKTPLLEFDLDMAFWVQNMVSNFCYSRWADVYPTLRNKIDSVQREFQNKVKIADDRALQAYQEKGAATAIRFVTQFGDTAGSQLHKLWMNFYGELFVKFRDFYIITAANNAVGINAQEPGMSDAVKERIVQDTGDHYKVVDGDARPDVVRGESWKARAIQPGLVAMEQLDKSPGAADADPDSHVLQAPA